MDSDRVSGLRRMEPDGLKAPIIGYWDFHWADHITLDLKTTEKLPQAIKIPHARQVSLYVASNNAGARVCYACRPLCAREMASNVRRARSASRSGSRCRTIAQSRASRHHLHRHPTRAGR
jgi:hypothetical protein